MSEADSVRPRIAVVGVPGSWSSEHLADCVAARGCGRLLVDMAEVVLDFEQGSVRFRDCELLEVDALIVKKVGSHYSPALLDRLEILRYLERSGVPVFSSPRGMARLIDRLSCTMELRVAGIPMPETLITEDVERAVEAVQRFGTAVIKPLFSTKARGMALLRHDDPELRQNLIASRAADNPTFYLQKLLPAFERDLGVAFLDGEPLGAYARVKQGDAWNTTTLAGGRYERHEPSDEVIEVARRAQACFDLSFTTVDVVETADGPLVFEVSAFGGFRGLRDGLDIDAAALYVDAVLRKINS